MEQMVTDLLAWISANPHWAGLVVFAIAFLESLAIVGLAVPGWLLLVGVGTFIGAGHLNFWWMSLASFSGAVLGQILSYSIGFHFKKGVLRWSWVQRHQKLLDRAELFFKRHGFLGILIGQFIGPIRAVIALSAGILSMPFNKFLMAVILATIIWAPIYMLPGVFVGAALDFDQQQMAIVLICLALLVISTWFLGHFILDWFKANKNAKPLSTQRKLVGLLLALILSGVIIFLSFTGYGYLMMELFVKTWQLIS